MSPDKSNLDGKWKKKKGPAPPRPLPPKRQVKKLPRKAVNNELMDIGKDDQIYRIVMKHGFIVWKPNFLFSRNKATRARAPRRRFGEDDQRGM